MGQGDVTATLPQLQKDHFYVLFEVRRHILHMHSIHLLLKNLLWLLSSC